MQIPDSGLDYTQSIIERCEDLIHSQIWSGIELVQLKAWLSNFSDDIEKYFAAWILDRLIYRSHRQTVALMLQLFQRVIPKLTSKYPCPSGPLEDIIQALDKNRHISYSQNQFRFVVAVRQGDPPTKSAFEIARIMKREFSLREDFFIYPKDIPTTITTGVRTFIFIDDFMGTGDQFTTDLIKKELSAIVIDPDLFFAYTPLTAHYSGIYKLKREFPQIKCDTVETLGEEHEIFNSNSGIVETSPDSLNEMRKFYYDYLEKKNIQVDKDERRGYGNLDLAYAFEHAAPDNSLPILWYQQDQNFHPLFKR